MREVKSKTGDVEKQPGEYAPDGPVRLAPRTPDSRGRLNGDGSKSALRPERPVYAPTDRDVLAVAMQRIEVLELQVRSLQMAAPRGIPKT